MSKFLTSFTFKKGQKMKNRLAVAPMTNMQSLQDGALGHDEFAWLSALAKGQFGLVFTCASHVSKAAQAWAGQLGIYKDELLPGLTKLADMFKQHGTLGIVQIFHGGSRSSANITGLQPSSASVFHLPIPGFEVPKALSKAEIEQIVQDFADAAERAHKAGFAGVEIHGANGYLITQFISTTTNLRKDEYGGDVAGRAKLAREIMQACRARVPADFLVGIRLSPVGAGLDVDETIQIAKWLVDDGADFIDLSLGDVMTMVEEADEPLVSYVRQALGNEVVLFSGGSIQSPAQAEKALELGLDGVTLGRTSIGNHNWPMLAEGEADQIVPWPYDASYLQSVVSNAFINYIKTELPPAVTESIVK